MGNKRNGQLTVDGGWRKHLRWFGRRMFWKKERKAAKRDAAKRTHES